MWVLSAVTLFLDKCYSTVMLSVGQIGLVVVKLSSNVVIWHAPSY